MEMSLDHYQNLTSLTAIYPDVNKRTPNGINYTVLGLAGEAGELSNSWKKVIRDPKDAALHKEHMRYELGDVLWYVARLAAELGMTLNDVAKANLDKLNDRSARGKLMGTGDKR